MSRFLLLTKTTVAEGIAHQNNRNTGVFYSEKKSIINIIVDSNGQFQCF